MQLTMYLRSIQFYSIPYGIEVWQEESLVNLMNEQHFANLKYILQMLPPNANLFSKYRIPGNFRGMYISRLSMKPGFSRLKFRR